MKATDMLLYFPEDFEPAAAARDEYEEALDKLRAACAALRAMGRNPDAMSSRSVWGIAHGAAHEALAILENRR